MVETKQQKIKVRIPETSNRWEPQQVGERLVGKYCKKEPTDYRGKKNNLYTIKTEDHPIRDQDGYVKFYGTFVLNDVLGKISAGYDVEIIYRGEQKGPDPKKRPMKLFDVDFWVDPNDPILQKIYPDGLPEDIQKKIDEIGDSNSGAAGDDLEPETEPEKEPESPTMNTADNVEVQAFVDGVEADLRDTGKNVLEVNVWALARKQAGDDKAFLDAVKKEIRTREYGN